MIRGSAYATKMDYDHAIEDFDQAIRLHPQDAVAFNSRGHAYQVKGDLDRSIADYTEAIRLDPGYIFALNNRGVAYQAKRDYDRAIIDHNEAIRLDPSFPFAYYSRGRAYQAKHDIDRAIADYDQAIRLRPNYAAALYWRGTAKGFRGTMQVAMPISLPRRNSIRTLAVSVDKSCIERGHGGSCFGTLQHTDLICLAECRDLGAFLTSEQGTPRQDGAALGDQPLMKARRSAFTSSFRVVHIPCGAPL
jgi:tetratricopeptide (TPR) repeat protein